MRYFLFLTLLLGTGAGQTTPPAGTVTQSTISTVTAVAGTVTCTLSNTNPVLASGIHAECKIGANKVLVMDSVIPSGNNGIVGSFSDSGNIVTWLVNQPTGQTNYSWQMAANGASKSGTF